MSWLLMKVMGQYPPPGQVGGAELGDASLPLLSGLPPGALLQSLMATRGHHPHRLSQCDPAARVLGATGVLPAGVTPLWMGTPGPDRAPNSTALSVQVLQDVECPETVPR